MEQICGNCLWQDDGFCDLDLRDVDDDEPACRKWDRKDVENEALLDSHSR